MLGFLSTRERIKPPLSRAPGFAEDLAAQVGLARSQNLAGSSGAKRWRRPPGFLEHRTRGAAKRWHRLRECWRGCFVKAPEGSEGRQTCSSSNPLLPSQRPSCDLFPLSLTTKATCVVKISSWKNMKCCVLAKAAAFGEVEQLCFGVTWRSSAWLSSALSPPKCIFLHSHPPTLQKAEGFSCFSNYKISFMR